MALLRKYARHWIFLGFSSMVFPNDSSGTNFVGFKKSLARAAVLVGKLFEKICFKAPKLYVWVCIKLIKDNT